MWKRLIELLLALFTKPRPAPGPSPDAYAVLLELHNQRRLSPLTFNAALMNAAGKYAALMEYHGRLEHGLNGRLMQRAEHIARSPDGPKDVFDLWMNSTLHRMNLLSVEFSQVGFGQSGDYYCAIYGG